MTAAFLHGGFAAPASDAAQAFRILMEAMARPGTVQDLEGVAPPPGLSVAAAVAVLTLCDADTGLHLAGRANQAAIRDWVRFHTGAPLVGAEACDFALGRWDDLHPLNRFKIGTPDYPDRSATLIVELDSWSGVEAVLSGPGIPGERRFALPDLAAFQANHARFPLGLDFFFTCGAQIAALPRSTQVR